ncbi:MAG: 5-formyltetrahydrofolate cyclo-ligase [Desulfovibrio sp.]|jgi:5-formyltetrahydrofolate cyclo-ligase|nr:5-formyltetrahydrofolate cyclo-ligase [Desulfovibrio sp.]
MGHDAEPTRPESTAAEKTALREHMRTLRENQMPGIARRHALRAQARLAMTEHWQNALSVALYAAARSEISVDALMVLAWQSRRTVYLPRVRRHEQGCMDFVACKHPTELTPSTFGLREPLESLPGFGVEDAGGAFRPDLMIVPGLAFDRQGMRLGFGGGYYDRFLRRLTDCPCVGICFDFQFVEALPTDSWDQPVRYVCTEERFWESPPLKPRPGRKSSMLPKP